MIELNAGGLHLVMASIGHRKEGLGGPYLEWIDIKVTVMASGIQAEGFWSVMPDEWRAFVRQLREMQDACKVGLRAELRGVEPNFSMALKMMERGAIIGDWRFQPEMDGAHVAGPCALDQSYLPSLIQGVEAILQSASESGGNR